MANNFFITGIPKAGKTTLVLHIIGELRRKGLKVGGFISPEHKEHGTREGFEVMDIATGRRETLACVGCGGPRVSKYGIDIGGFEDIALPIMQNPKKYDVIVMDEIGRMELKSRKFENALDGILESDTPIIATIHRDFVPEYCMQGKVYSLTDSNREQLFVSIINDIENALLGKRKPVMKPELAGKPCKKPAGKAKLSKAKKKAGKPAEEKKAENNSEKPKPRKHGFFESIRRAFGV